MSSRNLVIAVVVVLAVVGAVGLLAIRPTKAPTSPSESSETAEQRASEAKGAQAVTPAPAAEAGATLAGTSSKLYDFTKAEYEKAKATDKLVVLYFYANWCPECRIEVPKLYSAFNELTSDKVVGFRVNFNDSDTDSDEVALAREYGVAYQHTKVFLKNGQRILKSPESWDEARYLSEINKAL